MKVFSLGKRFTHTEVNSVGFKSNESALDYDIVVWDTTSFVREYQTDLSKKYKGAPWIDEANTTRIMRDMVRRKKEIFDILNLGRLVVIFTPAPTEFYTESGKKEFSGTGRNRHTTVILDHRDIQILMPVSFKTVEASGKNISYLGGEKFNAFWQETKGLYQYKAYIEEFEGLPIMSIAKAEKALAFYTPAGKGHLLFVPEIIGEDEDRNRFIDSIIALSNKLSKLGDDFVLPEWASDYTLPEERQKREQLVELENELARIASEIEIKKVDIAESERYKILFTGTGTALEEQVEKVLTEMGFEVSAGEPGRDDLIAKYGDKVAVIEIKGVTKSAAEKNAAQLEKWVAEYYSNHEQQPKGILIVNSYRELPLGKRTEANFPHQMLAYSNNRGHCLMTGQQLLGLYLEYKKDPSRGDELVKEVFETTGVLSRYLDWNDFLSDSKIEREKQDETLDTSKSETHAIKAAPKQKTAKKKAATQGGAQAMEAEKN